MITHTGGCHCGRVRFEVRAGEAGRARVQLLHMQQQWPICTSSSRPIASTFFPAKEVLTGYGFNTHTAKHLFCSVCGIKSSTCRARTEQPQRERSLP